MLCNILLVRYVIIKFTDLLHTDNNLQYYNVIVMQLYVRCMYMYVHAVLLANCFI